ncbi:MAG: hypothetical protein AB8E87_13375 [Prochlorococcus sp.]
MAKSDGPSAGRRQRLLLIGHDAFNAGAQRALLSMIGGLRKQAPALSLQLLLLGDGDLRPSYEALCPTAVLTLQELENDGIARLGFTRFMDRGGIILGNSVASLQALLYLRRQFLSSNIKFGLFIHEFPETAAALGQLFTMHECWKYLNLILTPSPLTESIWKDELKCSQLQLGPMMQRWLMMPVKDDVSLIRGSKLYMPSPVWPVGSEWRILGLGRDQESFCRFSEALESLRDFLPQAGGLWVGPVGQQRDGLCVQPTLNVSQALEEASVFLLTTGGSSKPGETFGLVAAEALSRGCPMLVSGTPWLGIEYWWPSELRDELSCLDGSQLIVRVLRVLNGGKKERIRRKILAESSMSRIDQDWLSGVDALSAFVLSL